MGGSVSHLWTDHIRPKTDARHYTKTQANARYVNVGETAANADSLDGLDSTAFVRSDVELPHARALQTATQSIPSTSVTEVSKVNLQALEFGSGLTLANNELTVTRAGVYSVTGSITLSGNGTGGRSLLLTKEGTTLGARDVVQAAPSAFGPTAHSVTTLARFNVGDRIAMFGGQSSGAPCRRGDPR